MAEEPDGNFFAGINKEQEDKENLEEAELFNNDFGDEDDMIDVTPEQEPEQEPEPEPKKEDKQKFKEEALIALGFKLYDNGEQGRKYTLLLWHNDINLKLGKTFKPKGQHFWWAFPKDSDPNNPDRMLKSDVIAKIPVVHLYNEIINGVVAMPAKTLVGHVHKRVGKSLIIEFESPEEYEEKGASFGEGAVKLDVNGKFIAASFSAATKEQSAKMKVPRCIRLPNYEAEMDSAPKKEKNTIPPAGHVPVQGEYRPQGEATTPITQNYTAEQIQEAEVEMAPYSLRMQIAIREAVRITTEEVANKIENQGLAGFVKDIATALFREPRLETESTAP